MYIFSFFSQYNCYFIVDLLLRYTKIDKEIEVEVAAASGRKDPRWKYACLINEKDTSTLICIFCDKVTKRDIYR